ncbi:MAG TPA: hypothetical protein VNX21_04600, partial [Candidatus Thermoplasmatota archaeon]|nr:hypothetical protein [Candidatus Thermoplasmatota archaeon]
RTYHGETPAEVLLELQDAKVPARGYARVDYVFLSPEIEAGVTLLQWENARPMSRAAIEKFDYDTLFEKVYDAHGVRIYRILWAHTA